MTTMPRVTERQFQANVRRVLDMAGWLSFHGWTSVFSPAGYPDICAVRGDRLLFAELKSATGKLSPAQITWLDALAEVPGVEVYHWKPDDLEEAGRILYARDRPVETPRTSWAAQRPKKEAP